MKDGWDKGAGEQRGRTRAVTNVLAELPLWAGPTNSRPPLSRRNCNALYFQTGPCSKFSASDPRCLPGNSKESLLQTPFLLTRRMLRS